MPTPNTPIRKYATYAGASGDQAALWSPAENVSAYITDIILTSDTATAVTLMVNAAAVSAFRVAQNTTLHVSLTTPIATGNNEVVLINIGTSSTLQVTLLGYEQHLSP